MIILRDYLNKLSTAEQAPFASKCGTSVGYLRKAISKRQALGVPLCIAIERNTGGAVTCEDLRPDIDWAYLRAPKKECPVHARV